MYAITLLVIISVAINSPAPATEAEAKAAAKKVAGVVEGEVTELDRSAKNKVFDKLGHVNAGYKSDLLTEATDTVHSADLNAQDIKGTESIESIFSVENPVSTSEVQRNVNTNADVFQSNEQYLYELGSEDSEHKHLLKENNSRRKQIIKELKDAGKIVGGVGVILGVTLLHFELINYLWRKLNRIDKVSKSRKHKSVLTPSNAQSPILSNVQSAHNATEHANTTMFSGVTELSHTTQATLQEHKSADSVTTHSSLNVKRVHTSMQKTIVYIVVIAAAALLFIAAGVFALIMQQDKSKQDLFTDMNQYYANDTTKADTIPVYPNASLNQRNYLI